jgi:hypothetical protein
MTSDLDFWGNYVDGSKDTPNTNVDPDAKEILVVYTVAAACEVGATVAATSVLPKQREGASTN